ncbi:MAG: gamma-glutamyl-gamma-aminobutyrate hydrolase family protein [Nocardioides sp.]|uniref:gamma-glutamyl-gamma-aminobutyrate hydrolase family protein n=1 Tax=Nocardioides sp. TaxID=35761 RepID=UPI0039E5AEC5
MAEVDPGAHERPPARPRILIPARFSASASALRYGAEVTARNLAAAVFAAGGEPLVLHPHAPAGRVSDDEVAQRLAIADGVLLPGGGDLGAHWSGQDAHASLYDVDDEQDAFDLAVARVSLAAGTPLLAVCRGLQVVNAVRGGTVVQDMEETYGERTNHRHHVHAVAVASDTALSRIVGDKIESSCFHHQCLDRLGEGMQVVARSDEGYVEAVEIPAGPGWFLGVQWHPEDTWMRDEQQFAVFAALVEAARN